MKRYASHYVLFPGQGFLKQHVVEIESATQVRVFPLTAEIEDTEWLPGILHVEHTTSWEVFHIPCFDFKAMKPVDGTLRRRLL